MSHPAAGGEAESPRLDPCVASNGRAPNCAGGPSESDARDQSSDLGDENTYDSATLRKEAAESANEQAAATEQGGNAWQTELILAGLKADRDKWLADQAALAKKKAEEAALAKQQAEEAAARQRNCSWNPLDSNSCESQAIGGMGNLAGQALGAGNKIYQATGGAAVNDLAGAAAAGGQDITSLAQGAAHLAVNSVAVVPYAVYWSSYEAARDINQIGGHFGLPGSIVSHIVAAPLVIPEALGLAGDVGLDLFKNKILGTDEQPNDEGYVGPIIESPFRNVMPGGGPQTYLPGWRKDGGVDFEW